MNYVTNVLIGIPALRARAVDFDLVFCNIPAPATGISPWMLVWIEMHPKYELWGVIVERNGNLVASAIFTRYRSYGVWFIGKPGGSCDQLSLGAVDDDAAARLAKEVYDTINDFGGPWRLEMHLLPYPDPVVTQFILSWPYCKTWLGDPEPCLLFASNNSLTKYLSPNTRSSVAKANNRIKREGIKMTKEWIEDPERILQLLPQIQDICRRRDYQQYGKSLMDDPAEESYWMTFMVENVRQGLIDLLIICLEGEIAAFAICLRDKSMYRVLTNRVCPIWLAYSPGTIANAEVVRHAFEESRGVNWGGGLQRYKLSGDVTLIPRQRYCAWSSAPIRILIKLLS
jgi:hypothetical protein